MYTNSSVNRDYPSVTHNLSLHTRFSRVPNESTGKSSWWIINPDAKQSKAQRRPRDRASSMDTQKYMAKRRNAKKSTEYKRTAAALAKGDLVSNSTDDLHYQLSPQPLCERSGSNTSSLHQLSPVPVLEDLLDDTASHWPAQNENFSESLAQSFASVSVQDSLQRRLNTPSPRQSLNVSADGTSPNYSGINDTVDHKKSPSLLESLLDAPSPPNPHVSQMNNPNRSPLTKSQVNVPNNTVSMLREALLSKNPQLVQLHLQQQQMQNFSDPGYTVQPNSFPIKQEPIYHFSEQEQNAVNDFDLFQDPNNGRQYPITIKQEFPNQIQHPDSLPDLKDIDISNDVDMSCNLDEIINQELDMEGTLEFNFDPASGHNGKYFMRSLLTIDEHRCY
ncbi:DgyrCDS29 [Dimorphilus gyrociliatus]|uniref:DgyrCDS29 n=1 Tax=Dimorphilus gyrociliatus TaxID=2664684 RepID=A0A7I8V4Y4_9ANNE|nr:DgyrCDS29 [Dimorphilus gyrociliatus]